MTPIICPRCGIPMNRHAEKVQAPTGDDAAHLDPVFGGLVVEVHACPRCGAASTRRAAS